MDSDMTSGTVPKDDFNAPQVKLKKVLLEFEDGTIKYLEGEDANTWMDSFNGQILMSWVHGARLIEFTWKQISKEDAASLFLK